MVLGDALLDRQVTDPDLLWRYRAVKDAVLCAGHRRAAAWWLLRRARVADHFRAAAARQTAHVLRHAPAGIVPCPAPTAGSLWANERFCELTGIDLQDLRQHEFRNVSPAF